MTSVIRLATAADPAAIAKVHVASWQQAYRDILPAEYLASLSLEQCRTQWIDAIAAKINTIFVAEIDSEIVGFSCIGLCRDEGAGATDFEILAIYVDAAYWTRGIGRELWLASRDVALTQGARSISLWVFSENARAIKFYQAAGFACEQDSLETFEIGGIEASEFRFSMPLS